MVAASDFITELKARVAQKADAAFLIGHSTLIQSLFNELMTVKIRVHDLEIPV